MIAPARCAFLLLMIGLSTVWPAHADSTSPSAREAGPEDGILCCNGATLFLFRGDEVLTTTGRAGIVHSDHRGERWRRSMSGLVASNGVSPFADFICQSPSRPRVVYALAGLGGAVTFFNGIFSSDDFGETWTRRGTVDTGFGFNSCAVDAADPRTVYVYGTDSNFDSKSWISTDGGKTVQEHGSLPPCAVGGSVHPVRGALYVSSSNCVVASIDGGLSFQLLSLPGGFIGKFDASPDGRQLILTTYDDAFTTASTFRSIDRGASFDAVSGLPIGYNSIAFDPSSPSRIYAADGQLHVSLDGGLTFTALPNDPRFLGPFPVREIGIDPRGSVYLSNLAGPFRSDDAGKTFRSLLNEFRASAVQDLAFDANGKLLVGVLHTQVVFRKTYGWTFSSLGTALVDPNGFEVDAASVGGSPADANVILVATPDRGLLRTDNGGRSWASATMDGNARALTNSRMAFVNGSRAYLVAPGRTASGLYRSDDAGVSFARLSTLRFGTLAVDPSNPDVLYAGTFGNSAGLFKSTDGGGSLQSLGQGGDFSALAIDRGSPSVIYAGLRFGQVIRSSDGGQTFTTASSGLTGAGVLGLTQDVGGTLYVWLRAGGLFSSSNGGSSWQPVDVDEALRRSGVESGRASLVVDPRHPGRLYLGNAGVIRVSAMDDVDPTD